MKKIYFQKRLLESFQKNRERIAIEYGTREIKYSQLEKKCLSVSHWLLGHKTSKESFIGIYIEDRVDFIAVLLGILNIGGVFIPLDTHLPVKRIEKMLQVTQPGLIICDQQGQRRLLYHLQTNINPGRIICISQVFNEGDDLQSSIEDVVEYSSEDPIYVYFTSGTTGTPKAILGKNISLLHFINWEIQTFSINETFQVSQLTALSFDAFLRDLFVPLLAGGTLCIPVNPEILMDSESLIYWLETNRIGLVHCVPSIFRIFNTKALKKENFQHLKYILLSGESIIPQELKNWFDIMGDRIQLVNLYGPTETTMIKTCYYIKKEDVNRGRIPIGKPMKGARLILFDKNMKICEPGFIGDIYIRTPYRTFGYLNDPQLNLEKFIPNPLGGEQTDLLFKAGDQGLELSEGDFEFLGRRDRQVKIRGIRVELEEVERAMLQYPYIDNAAVIDREEKDRDKYLCAYFISRGTVEISELREYLSEELPDYMIPSYFLQLEAFPLSPNGKLNRKALPAPGLRPVENDEAPMGRIQETLVNIWSEVLKIDRKQIGINSDFFELGGHSLKAIILAYGIHQALNVKIALTQIFKTHTIRELSGYIKQEHKYLQAQDRYIAIEPVEKKEYYALSSAQKRLFILHQWDKAVIGYNMPRIVELEGNLDRNRLEETFKKLTARHESLRTSFEMVKDDPVQKIHQDFCLEIEYYCAERKAQRAERKEERYAPSTMRYASTIKDFVRPFDLSQAPLLRVGLIKIAIDIHILMVDMHHIISDATSMDIFIRDFIALYSGAGLPGLEISYKDYSGWHNKEKEYIKHQEEFWAREFKGEISVLDLPTDYTRPGVVSFEGQRVRFQLEDKITNALNQLAREQDATLYMVLLAIYNIWLSKICGQEDIIVGSPIAGRRHVDLEKIIGMFVNTMALRNYPSGEKSFTDFLREVRTRTLTALENQDYQFEDLVDKVVLNRNLSRNPLFDVMFVLQNTGISKLDIPGLKFKRCELETGISKFDLTFNCEEVEGKLIFLVEFNTKLFLENTIHKFINYFKKIVSGILASRNRRIGEIEILSEKEQRQLLHDFNDTAAWYPKDQTIHQLFEEQVEQTPHHTALVGEIRKGVAHPAYKKSQIPNKKMPFGWGQLSYKELNERANQLAYLLKEKVVKSDNLVALMLDRSIEMIISLLGILKSGGGYLPIDPDYPEYRIKYMLEDSNAKILMTTPVLFEKFEKLSMVSCQLLMINEELTGRRRLNTTPQEANSINNYQLTINNLQLEPPNLAYIIYTSGTTGKPKGVMIQHRNVVRLMVNERSSSYFDFTERDVWTMFHSYCFDFSVWEMYGALLYGGKLVIIPKMTARDPEGFLKELKEKNVTILNQTPTAFYNLSTEELKHLTRDLNLRCVIFGGEALNPIKLSQWRKKYPGIKLVNMFGITETTVHVTYKEITGKEIELNISNIGKPIPTLSTYIMDKNLVLLPPGIPGELFVGGEGVARGYLNRVELTAKKFLANPYKAKEIIYRSGDRAKFLDNGEMEYLGRIDHQVQVKGYRIEPGEIENQLLKYRKIKEAVVLTGEEEGEKYLCAYIVSDNEFKLSELGTYLSGKLPAYMIPSYFVRLERIPLTPNGKVDRDALPGPEGISLREDVDYKLPSSAVEKKLVEIWEKVLGRNNIGIDENFFMMGGDSIKSIQIISRMSSAGYKLEIKDLFQYPTIFALAPRVKKLKRIPDQSAIKGVIPLTPIQRDFFGKTHIDSHHYNQAVLLYSREGFAKGAIMEVFSKIQQHHDALRMTYELNTGNGEIVQIGHDPGYPLSLQEYDLKNRRNSIEELNAKLNQVQTSIDLEKGPLMKLALFHLDDGDRLLIAVHHLVIDGVSWRILFEDIETLYGQYNRGEKLVLPSKTDSFKLWSEKLSAFADDKILLQEKAYWRKIESVEVPSIPKDFDVVDADNNYIKDTVSVSFTLSEKETGDLLTKVNEIFKTEINDILLTALGIGIKKKWGHDRVLIALEGHGREEILEDIDISRTVGWFTSLYPVLIDISYSSDPGRQIKEIKETLRRIPNKGVEYGILKYLTGAGNKKEIEFKLKPQISFNYLGQFDADVKQKSTFEIARESAGNRQSLNSKREYVLDVTGMTANNCITMTISYNKMHFKPETMAQLMGNFESELKHLIVFCCTQENIEPTPSDFTYKGLSIERVDELMKEYPGIEDVYTLTPMQEGMLFHSLVDDTSSSYFEQMSYRLQAELDIELVEKSFNELFKRHDILRTVFVYQDIERPVQVVLQERAIDFYYEDISQIREREEKQVFIDEYKEKDKVRSFNLEKDVLMRLSIFRVDESEYEVTWSHHHILMDGWCLGILNSEFFEIYNAYLENRPNRLPGVKAYRTYIRWLEKQDKEAAARYWANYLDSFAEQTGVPKTRITKEGSRNKNETVSVVLDKEKSAGLNKLAGRNHVTLNTVTQAVWGILLGRYNGKEDMVFGAVVSGRPSELEGVESMVGLFINTIPVRIKFEEKMKFYRLLQGVQEEALAGERYHYHPLAEIQSGTALKQNLIDHLFIFENYPIAEQIEGYGREKKAANKISLKLANVEIFEQNNYDFNVVLSGPEQIRIAFNYNGNTYDIDFVEQLARHYSLVLDQVMESETLEIRELTILSKEEKDRILYEFNVARAGYPENKTIHRLFEEQVEKEPEKLIFSYIKNMENVLDDLISLEINRSLDDEYKSSCFKKNEYIFAFMKNSELKKYISDNLEEYSLLRTHRGNFVMANTPVLSLLNYYNGNNNLISIYEAIANNRQEYKLFTPQISEEAFPRIKKREHVHFVIANFEDLINLVKRLYILNLINLVGYNPHKTIVKNEEELGIGQAEQRYEYNDGGIFAYSAGDFIGSETNAEKMNDDEVLSPVLLLGDTVGAASVGLLYIASFLRRRGIKAYCQWNNFWATNNLLKKHVKGVLIKAKPKVVGISLKWFPHIARVLRICEAVKEYNSGILVVVGGNTASYYHEELIKNDCIDYVVRGDGEVPLYSICTGKEYLPNCTYEKDGEIIKNPISYVQDDTNSAEVFLYHLDEIFLSELDPYLAAYFYINTGKGCSQKCLYCAGCQAAQKKVFNRPKPFLRGKEEIRRDIKEGMKYSSTLMFDFDLPMYDSINFYREMWGGIPLSGHFCDFYFWLLPSRDFIQLAASTFKYVYLNIDICSLSEDHRLKLSSMGLVKTQPTDKELFDFFDNCEKFSNVEVIINHIAGLPYFSPEDIKKSRQVSSRLLDNYSCFRGMDWGRLHAQPGAPILEQCHEYGMYSYANNYEDFLHYSQLNLEESTYPPLKFYNYPYIYFNDDELNSQVSKYYFDVEKEIEVKILPQKKRMMVNFDKSYQYINEQANRLAYRLRSLGGGSEKLIGIMVEPSLALIIGLLGILKSGSAYVPIDYKYPPARFKYILEDCGVNVLVTREQFLGKVKDVNFNGTIIDSFEESSHEEKIDNPPFNSRPGNLCYVIYTSGSTGKPKGVMIEHNKVVTLVHNFNYIDVSREDRLFLTGSIGFDITTFEIWGSLLKDIKLYIGDRDLVLHYNNVKDVVFSNNISLLHLIPQLFDHYASQVPEIFSKLRYLLVGGDFVRPKYINEIRKKNHRLKILHMYGPTENTTFSTFFPVVGDYETRIPIGKPISNSTVVIVDNHLHLQPIGVVGELCVGGDGLARGYLNNPELTAEKFDHDFWYYQDYHDGYHKSYKSYPTDILYKTGDLARWLPDGNIEFIGRRDHQVKIRGIRIELGEIDVQLRRHPRIEDVVVVSREDQSGDRYICAYILSIPGPKLEVSQLRDFLAPQLPSYMIPSRFVFLNSIPLTSNGKVDRKALPVPEIELEVCGDGPRNDLEKKLVELWAGVLARDAMQAARLQTSIGIYDNFFQLGGHSLKATILVSKIHKEFDVKVPLAEVIKMPRIRELAEYIKERRKELYTSVEPAEKKEYYLLSSAQKRLYILQMREMNNMSYNMPAAYLIEGKLDKEKFEESIQGIIDQHEPLRTSFEQIDAEDEPIQKIEKNIDFRIKHEKIRDEKDIKNKVNEFVKPFDISKAPLMRAALIEMSEKKYIVLFDIHHIISDGSSMEILVDDFARLYEEKNLSPLSVQYKDYVAWNNRFMGGKKLAKQEIYWLRKLNGFVFSQLPITNFQSYKRIEGKQKMMIFDPCLVDGIEKFCHKHHITKFTFLITTFEIALSREINQQDITIGIPVSIRSHFDLKHLMGIFLNVVLIRCIIDDNDSFLNHLSKSKETVIEALKNQDYPYEILDYKIREKGYLNDKDLFSILFNFFPQETDKVAFTGDFEIHPYKIGDIVPKYDMTVYVYDNTNGIRMNLVYKSNIYKEYSIQNLLDNFLSVIHCVLENNEIKLSEIASPTVVDADDFDMEFEKYYEGE